MNKIINPILPGFHPDPCLCKAEDTYYLITSTFEWVPGISVYESKDMVNWTSHGAILKNLDLTGIPDSCGIWAPAITWDNGIFYVIYTIASQIDGIFKDVKNYVTTAPSIDGPWSEPLYLNASGFDPSMFHENGKHYVLNPRWDYRPLEGHSKFSGLLLQEFDFKKGMVGPSKVIFSGSHTGGTEGPHLMKRNGYYYILAAEGGTGRHHSIVVARSKDLWGPYEISPYHPLITSWEKDTTLKKSGHGNLVEGLDGWYLTHLCARYMKDQNVCPLGRETALEKIEWIDDWPKLIQEDNAPLLEIETEFEVMPKKKIYETNFKNVDLVKDEWLSLRKPFETKLQYSKEGLILQGRDSLCSLFDQSLIARRVTSFDFKVETSLSFEPYHYAQMAGLTLYYNTKVFHTINIRFDEEKNCRVISLLTNNNQNFIEPLQGNDVEIPDHVEIVEFMAEVHQENLQFFYRFGKDRYVPIGPVLDFSILSDEHAAGWAYTGAMVGIYAADLFNKDISALFRTFRQENLKEKL